MSEYQSITFLLGFFGFILSCIALIISFLTYRRQEPRLEIQVEKCIHNYKVSKTSVKEVRIYSFFKVFNKGDRRTRLSKAQLHVLTDGKKHQLKTAFVEDGQLVPESTKWIEAHDIADIATYSAERADSGEKERIKCTFKIFHTHGSKAVSTISKRQEDLSLLRDYIDKLP